METTKTALKVIGAGGIGMKMEPLREPRAVGPHPAPAGSIMVPAERLRGLAVHALPRNK